MKTKLVSADNDSTSRQCTKEDLMETKTNDQEVGYSYSVKHLRRFRIIYVIVIY